MAEAEILRVKLVRSPIGCTQRQRQTLRALGLTRVGRSAVVHNNAPTKGRIRAVEHLIEVQK
ncbi:MAG: 50S ribosomal protein L30 [Deltaproteobacteria bacterium]|nr:50S ribosomal protein L30 [Deltaproteobacteria bacterium]